MYKRVVLLQGLTRRRWGSLSPLDRHRRCYYSSCFLEGVQCWIEKRGSEVFVKLNRSAVVCAVQEKEGAVVKVAVAMIAYTMRQGGVAPIKEKNSAKHV